MFDNYPPGISPNNNPVSPTPVDMYAGINSSPVPPATNMQNQNALAQPLPSQAYPPTNNSSVKFLIIGLVTLVLVLAGAFTVYQMVLKPKLENNLQTIPVTTIIDETQEINPDDTMFNDQVATSSDTEFVDLTATSSATSSLIVVEPSSTSSVPIDQPVEIDSDMDGLNDSLETLKGTNKNLADTDADGLNDGDEVLKHETNPLKADTDTDGLNDGDEILKYQTKPLVIDTDGDSFADGLEVEKGYNPLGTGRMVVPIK